MLSDAETRAARFPIGASLTLEGLQQDPIGIPERLRREEPVTWCPDADAWFVAGRALAEEVIRDTDRFTADFEHSQERLVLGRTMLTTDGPDHDVHRRPFDGPLRARHVRSAYTDLVDRRIAELIAAFQDAGHVDLMARLAEPLGIRVVTDVLGCEVSDEELVQALMNRLRMALHSAAPVEVRHAANAVRREFGVEVSKALANAGERAPESILGTVAREYPGRLGEEMIVDNTINLVFGGVETTATGLGTALWALLSHPEQLAEVRSDRSLIPAAVTEAIRLHPAFGVCVRAASQDTTLGGVEIKAGDHVHPMLMAANRDPAICRDPDRYDLHRKDGKRNLSFGVGLHFCIGQNLARLVAERAMDAALTRLPGLRLDPDRPARPEGFDFHRLRRLDALWDASDPTDAS
jgi:cytochrome P450